MTRGERHTHVVVVGAGVFGATAALELRRRGHVVSLLDRGIVPHEGASSTDVSKMIRMDYGSDVFYHELADAAIEGWERWNAEWGTRLYHDEGFLVLSGGPMRRGGFEHESHRVLVQRGYRPERVGAEELARRFPAWSPAHHPDGYLSPRGGWAESGAVVAHLLRLCEAAGVRLRTSAFAGLLEVGSRVGGVRVRSAENGGAAKPAAGVTDEIRADHVLVCAGAWTPTLLPWLSGVLRTVAQPVLHFGVADPDAWRGPHFPPFAADIAGTGWYGFPALDDGRLKLGHHGAGRVVHPDTPGEVDARHVERARAFLAASLPALADAPVVGSRVCLYCDSFDGDLLVARDPAREGLTVATGGSGHAFKFAPMLGTMIADAVEGRPNRWNGRFGWRIEGPARNEEARLTGEAGPRTPGREASPINPVPGGEA
jgi:sarcosine oxidase / L-pipecolate oxidase